MKDWYWKHFKRSEFCCPCCQKGGEIMDMWLIWLLEVIRAHYNKPIIINSGYRCEKHNKEVGGAKNSQHLYGDAVDIRIQGGADYDEVAKWLRDEILTDWGGLGIAKNYIHIDLRDEKTTWRY